jgi:secondary thiamine-phosphate synthase enzyme
VVSRDQTELERSDMKIVSDRIRLSTKGAGDLIDITRQITDAVQRARLQTGNITIFVVGSTAGITTFEYEPGLIRDMQEFYEKLAPSTRSYHHDETWGDANGFSHMRAMFTGPSLTVPFEQGRLLLGTWQQVVLAEFDNRPRNREIVLQIMGE